MDLVNVAHKIRQLRQQQQLTQQRLLKKQSKEKIRQKLKLVFLFTSSLITS